MNIKPLPNRHLKPQTIMHTVGRNITKMTTLNTLFADRRIQITNIRIPMRQRQDPPFKRRLGLGLFTRPSSACGIIALPIG